MMSLVLLAQFAPAAPAPQVTVQDVVHYSQTLGRETTFTVVLPSMDSGKGETSSSLPVLYLLHGYGGNHRDWVDRTRLSDWVAQHRLIVVLPDGAHDSWWLNSPLRPQSQVEDYLTTELPALVEGRWSARKDRAGRAIAGLSMGGHGALVTATRHPDRYASASSLSGILDLRVYPNRWGLPTLLDTTSRTVLLQASFVGVLEQLRQNPAPAIFFDCGTSDTLATEANRRAHEMLTNRGIHHQWQERPGTHNWEYWNEHLQAHLDFHQRVRLGLDGQGTTVPSGPRPPDRWRDLYTSRTLSYEAENEAVWIPLALNPRAPESSRPIVLMGSSTFEIRDIRGTLPGYPVAYRGISADRLGLGERGLVRRLYCSVIDLRPRAVFILNGTNDLGSLSEPGGPTMADLHQTYEQIVRRIQEGVPGVRIYPVSLSPLRDNYLRLVPKVVPYNEGVKNIAQRLAPQVRYVDQWSHLHDGQGVLLSEYSRDGLHLNARGYGILGNVLRKALRNDGILTEADVKGGPAINPAPDLPE
jgi:S-formylglutathione hydrolase FrmB/lysophospholipase L1-like esterase